MTQGQPEERGASVSVPPPLVFLGGVLLGLALNQWVRPAPVGVSRTISVTVGVMLMLLALVLVVSARMLFSRTGQSPIPWKPTPELIFSGPYRFTRNPMYVGLTTFGIGLGLALNNLWICAFALWALLIVHVIAVRPEEAYLSEKFGDSYRTYLTRVRRYI
jgi:protein-S-isoprenylcysteine O-methyltransferase Ste14